jgi:hypothetical protein
LSEFSLKLESSLRVGLSYLYNALASEVVAMNKHEEANIEKYEAQALGKDSKVYPSHHASLGTLAID